MANKAIDSFFNQVNTKPTNSADSATETLNPSVSPNVGGDTKKSSVGLSEHLSDKIDVLLSDNKGIKEPNIKTEEDAKFVSSEVAEAQSVKDFVVPADIMSKFDVKAATVKSEKELPETEREEYIPPEIAANNRAKIAWIKSRQERKQEREEFNKKLTDKEKALSEALAELAKTKNTKIPEVSEIAELKQKLEQAEDKIGQLDVTQSRLFKEQFTNKLDSSFLRGVKYLESAGKDSNSANAIMAKLVQPGLKYNEIQELLSDEPVAVQGAIFQLVSDIQEVRAHSEEAKKNWRATQAADQEENRRVSVAELSKSIVADTSEAIEQVKQEGSWLFAPSATDQNWNNQISNLSKQIHGILRLSVDKPKVIAKYVAEGIVAPIYRKLYEHERERVRSLEEDITKQQKSRPSLRDSGTPTSSETKDKSGAKNVNSWLDEKLSGSKFSNF
jgi:hypothetical protein